MVGVAGNHSSGHVMSLSLQTSGQHTAILGCVGGLQRPKLSSFSVTAMALDSTDALDLEADLGLSGGEGQDKPDDSANFPAGLTPLADENDGDVASCASDSWDHEPEFGPANADESDAWVPRFFAHIRDAGKIRHVRNQLSHGVLLTSEYSGQPVMNHELKDLAGTLLP